jgi:hypothetical protein
MSTRFEAANSESAGRDNVTTGAALTIGGYFYIHTLPASGFFAPIVTVNDGPDFAGWSLFIDSAGHLRLADMGNDNISAAGTATVSAATWYYVWIRQPTVAFGDMFVYFNKSTTEDITKAVSMGTTTRVEFATNQSIIESATITHAYGDVSLDAWKAWSTDLAASNATTEANNHTMTTTTNAIAAWFLDGTDVTDHQSTNSLTAIGTLSAGPDSPIDSAAGPTIIFVDQLFPRRYSTKPTNNTGQLYP